MRTGDLRELKRLFDGLQQGGYRQYKVQLRYMYELLEETPRFRSIFDLLRAPDNSRFTCRTAIGRFT